MTFHNQLKRFILNDYLNENHGIWGKNKEYSSALQ